MGRFDGRVAIVTGAGSGIGEATVSRFAADGASVIVADIDAEAAKRVAAAIIDAGGCAMPCAADVAEEDSVIGMIDVAVSTFGGLDILHNNAAAVGQVTAGGDVRVTEATVEAWDRMLAVNLRGVMLGCKHAIPRMIERGGGVIVNTTSTAALAAGPNAVAYAASKSGIVAVTQHVAARYGPDNIRCVAVAPGLTVRPGSPAPQWFIDLSLRHQPTPRIGRPQDLANVITFLASDEAAFVNGTHIVVDGGASAMRPTFPGEIEHLQAATMA